MKTVTYKGNADGSVSDALEVLDATLPVGKPVEVSDQVVDALENEPNVSLYEFEVGPTSEQKLTGQALVDRIKELGLDGTSDLTADEKRAKVAEAEEASS